MRRQLMMESFLIIFVLISGVRLEILRPDNIATGPGRIVINAGNGINNIVIDGSQYELTGPGTVIKNSGNVQISTNDIPGNPINIANSN